MAKLFGTTGEITSAREAQAAVVKAEAVLEAALATAADPETDSEVRAARIQLAGAQAALDQIEAPLIAQNKFENKFILVGIALLLGGIGLAVLVFAIQPEGGFTIFILSLAMAFIGWRMATRGTGG